MIKRVKTRPQTGILVVWDGTNADEVREVAGARFLSIWEEFAVILASDNITKVYVHQGWSIARYDGNNDRVYINADPDSFHDIIDDVD